MRRLGVWSAVLGVLLIASLGFTAAEDASLRALEAAAQAGTPAPIDVDPKFPDAIDPPCLPARQDVADDTRVTRLDIAVGKSRQWLENLMEAYLALERDGGIISDDYKGSFEAKVDVRSSDGSLCRYKAEVRLSGDFEHITTVEGSPAGSLDVKLEQGNADGMVRFKLLLPETRNGDAEIVTTELFRRLGFISPRTSNVMVSVNGLEMPMLMQENPAKELLESQNLRESALLEVDESMIWADRAKGRHDAEFEQSMTFARVTNAKWAQLGPVHATIAWQGLEMLSRTLSAGWTAPRADGLRDEEAMWRVSPSLIGNGNEAATATARRFEALAVAAGASHALWNHNRRFYYDPMLGGLLPLYFDGDAELLDETWQNEVLDPAALPKPLRGVEPEDRDWLVDRLESLPLDDVETAIRRNGAEVDRSTLETVVAAVVRNLDALAADPTPRDEPQWTPAPHQTWRTDLRLVFGSGPADLEACALDLSDCARLTLDVEGQLDMLRSRLYVNGVKHVYAGPSRTAYEEGADPGFSRRSELRPTARIADTEVLVSGTPTIAVDRRTRTLTAVMGDEADRVIVKGGSPAGWRIEVAGAHGARRASKARFDTSLLTGCLTVLDTEVRDLEIVVSGGLCEDGVNFVRVDGTVALLEVSTADQDAIDADFSHLEIEDVRVNGTGNDCLDLSSGSYRIGSLTAVNCTDKGLSVGERSTVRVSEIHVDGAVTGLVAKDSSTLTVGTGQVSGAEVCASAYRKKQEFGGAVLRLGTLTCDTDEFRAQTRSSLRGPS